jgi:hypothetical protein
VLGSTTTVKTKSWESCAQIGYKSIKILLLMQNFVQKGCKLNMLSLEILQMSLEQNLREMEAERN